TRLDTPPFSNRHHPFSAIARIPAIVASLWSGEQTGAQALQNFITIKTSKTEIGFNGLRDWYLLTHFGRYRVERYRDLDGNIRWTRTDTVGEAQELSGAS
ncbi:hypothetical protein, partial [Mesorhizobium huakuii]|uniref:hypothetical protein n=1 Tax=Mesorhizobium huakuii TaxID=28104 RepID=UPI0024E11ECD